MGDKWHFYTDPTGNLAVSIGEYDNLQEYAQTLQMSPTTPYVDYECTPLIEMDEKAFRAWLDSQKAAK
jgi:hypothetical protein